LSRRRSRVRAPSSPPFFSFPFQELPSFGLPCCRLRRVRCGVVPDPRILPGTTSFALRPRRSDCCPAWGCFLGLRSPFLDKNLLDYGENAETNPPRSALDLVGMGNIA